MGYSREIQNAAMQKIESRRKYAQQEAEIRKSKIFEEIPEAKNYEKNKLVPVTLRDYKNHHKELSKEEKMQLLGEIGTLTDSEVKELIFEVLTPIGYNMMVTPKEIDINAKMYTKSLIPCVSTTTSPIPTGPIN